MTNSVESIAHHYHERTKYTPESIATKSRGLDWSKQPLPYKEYKIGTVIDLKPYLEAEGTYWQRLSRLLLLSYGLTAKIENFYGESLYLRSAPSAGGLYPGEIYLISRGTEELAPGLYNYQVYNHTLVHFWGSDVSQSLAEACFYNSALDSTPIALVITAIFYRSSWRYEDRAYRRICLDIGHLLGNIELAGALNDFRPHLIGGFQEEKVNQLMYLDEEQEGAICMIGLADLLDSKQIMNTAPTALPSPIDSKYPSIADGDLLQYFHKATQITHPVPLIYNPQDNIDDKYNFPFCLKVPMTGNMIDWRYQLEGLEKTILQRRSTRAYNGANITLKELKEVLHFTYQPMDYLEQGLDGAPDYFDLSLIQTFIAVSGVMGLEEGCYYYAPKAQELRQIRFKNFRSELHYLCLGQELGRDAAVVIFHCADLDSAVAKYGDRAYRYLHLDAGHLGQRLNLAAIYLNMGVSGIGGFFDDQVNEILGIPEDEAVLYITTLGRAK